MNSEENETVALCNLLLKAALSPTVPEEWKVENVTVKRISGLTQISV